MARLKPNISVPWGAGSDAYGVVVTTPGTTLAIPSSLPCFARPFFLPFFLFPYSLCLPFVVLVTYSDCQKRNRASGQKQCLSPGQTLELCGQMLEMFLKDELPGLRNVVV